MAAMALADTMEVRMTRLESDVAHIRSDVADLKTDVRGLRQEFGELRMELRVGFEEMRRELTRGLLQTRIWMLLLCAAMLGVIARGLHWL
ncbi:MAG TPA: hypothetical protein VIC29_10745 [Steroidobacteraceae bacterium]|jgi:septation ring formation regulator EzrA